MRADLGEERQVLSLCGHGFSRAYLRATEQALLEAHELAFRSTGEIRSNHIRTCKGAKYKEGRIRLTETAFHPQNIRSRPLLPFDTLSASRGPNVEVFLCAIR